MDIEERTKLGVSVWDGVVNIVSCVRDAMFAAARLPVLRFDVVSQPHLSSSTTSSLTHRYNTMGMSGMLIYRARGRYYQTYLDHYPLPNYAGTMLVKDVPSDPDEYKGQCHCVSASLITADEVRVGMRQDRLLPRAGEADSSAGPGRPVSRSRGF